MGRLGFYSWRPFAPLVACCLVCHVVASAEPSGEAEPGSEIATNSIGMKLALLPAGEFEMGAPESDELAEENERPRHRVKITRPFRIGVHEVTVGQFRAFIEASGHVTAAEKGKSSGYNGETRTFEYDREGFHWKNPGWEQTERHPVLNVNWFDCRAFCRWLSEREKITYRLPTEAEWEYACRAGTTARFVAGDSIEHLKGFANLQDQSLFALRPEFSNSETSSFLRKPVSWDDAHPFSAPVGSFEANAFGLHDMLGNAAEWCGDWLGADYYANSPEEDPPGATSAEGGRVVRGGAFLHQPSQCRATWRIGGTPSYHNYIIGFRVVAEVAPEAPHGP